MAHVVTRPGVYHYGWRWKPFSKPRLFKRGGPFLRGRDADIMFISFFYKLKEVGIPVTPTSFLTLQRALNRGLVDSLDDFYTCARAILIKSERYFDLYDQVFFFYFEGVPLPENQGFEIDELARAMLDEWLKDPKQLSDALGIDPKTLKNLTPEELIDYFKERLKDQKGRHQGGNKWIGTGGTSPVGAFGLSPRGHAGGRGIPK